MNISKYNGWISKTNWTLVITILLAIGNAVMPFMSEAAQATVTTILLAIAGIFHVSGVNKAAIASATLGQPYQANDLVVIELSRLGLRPNGSQARALNPALHVHSQLNRRFK